MSMKKNFFKFLLLGAFTLSLGAGFVGCKDYDDDIEDINKRLASLEKFQQEVGSSVSGISFSNGILTATKLDGSTATIDLKSYFAHEIKIEGGKLMVDGTAVGEVGGGSGEEYDYDFSIVDGKLVITLNGEDFKSLPLTATGTQVVLEYDTDGNIIRAYAEDEDGKTVDIWVQGSAADPGSLITDFKVIDNSGYEMQYQYLDFGTATAAVNYVFGATYPGAITFVKNSAGEDAEAVVTVKVNPASALLNAASISLQDSKKNTEIMNYVQVSEVKRTEKLITKAGAESGLWDITFKMNSSVDKNALAALTTGENGRPIGYALVIENKLTGAGERYIVGDYMFEVDANDKTPRDFLNFNVVQGKNEKDVYDIGVENVGLVTDMEWTGAGWDATKPANVTSAVRSASPLYSVEIGKDITIKLVTNDVYAYYVTFDDSRALISAGVPDNNQIAAWKGYGITGLNNVVKTNDGVVKINIPAAALNAKIGFNVFAVNYDGHLIDPDGVPFWVIAGGEAGTGEVALTLAPATKVPAANTALATQQANFAPGFTAESLISLANSTFTMTVEKSNAAAPGSDQTFDMTNLAFFQANGTTAVTTDADVPKIGKIQLNNVVPYIMKKDTPYTGTLTFKNQLGAVVKVYTVTLTKPDVSFPLTLAFKPGYSATNGTFEVILNGTENGDNSSGAEFDMETYLTAGSEGFTNVVFAQNVTPTPWLTFSGADAAVAVADLAKLGSGATPVTISYNWGYFDYATESTTPARGNYMKSSSSLFSKLDIKSSVQKATTIVANPYNFTGGTLPADATRTNFQWGLGTAELAENVITAAGLKVMNPAINLPFDFLTPDANIASITAGFITEGAGGTKENPDDLYFTPGKWTPGTPPLTWTSGTVAATIDLKNNIGDEIQVPSTDLNLTLVFEVTDQFGNTSFWKSADGVFKGVVNALPDSE